MAHIDYFLSPISPWTYLAGSRPARIAAAAGLELRYRPVDPTALFRRTGGQILAERHESRKAYRLQELARWSAHLGMRLDLQPPFFPTNPAPASYAIIAAQESEAGGDLDALVIALTRACWAEGRNIADDDVIRDCLAQAGFDTGLAFSGMLQGAEIYPRNLEDAVAAGVFGVPTFMIGENLFWGQDRLALLAAHLGLDAASWG